MFTKDSLFFYFIAKNIFWYQLDKCNRFYHKPAGNETGIFQHYSIDTMATHDLAPFIARS